MVRFLFVCSTPYIIYNIYNVGEIDVPDTEASSDVCLCTTGHILLFWVTGRGRQVSEVSYIGTSMVRGLL